MSFQKTIGNILRRELRAIGLACEPMQPLPADLDVEGEVLSAILCGDITPADLKPLAAAHFYSEIHAAIWNASDVAPGDMDGVRKYLRAAGWLGAIEEELEQLAFKQPWRSRDALRRQADRIIELSKRRELIRRLQRLEADLRTDRISEAEALEQLRGVRS